MPVKALFLGAIGTVSDTSDLQRQAFNRAFTDAGLDWNWEWKEYSELLKRSGGRRRVAEYAAARGQEVDADAIHAAKVRHFEELAADGGNGPREGLAELVEAARARDIPVAFVTSTGRDQVELTLRCAGDALSESDLAFVGDRSQVENAKPAPDIYALALDRLDLEPDDVLVIEDTPASAQAALDAGLTRVIGAPTREAADHDWQDGVEVVDRLSADLLDR